MSSNHDIDLAFEPHNVLDLGVSIQEDRQGIEHLLLFFRASPSDPSAPTFHPVTSRYPENELVGELEPKDLEFMCAGGFVAETQTYYNFLEDGTFITCQIVHSSIGYVRITLHTSAIESMKAFQDVVPYHTVHVQDVQPCY